MLSTRGPRPEADRAAEPAGALALGTCCVRIGHPLGSRRGRLRRRATQRHLCDQRDPAQTQAPLAEVIRQLGVSKQAAGQLVDSLVVRGYLDRTVDPDDRRRLIVTLTERGGGRGCGSRCHGGLPGHCPGEACRARVRGAHSGYPGGADRWGGDRCLRERLRSQPSGSRPTGSGSTASATPFGDPSADERFARDVAATISFEPNEIMSRYLRGRTSFFDRVVVNALDREVRQIVTVGAGYDSRSLRYGKAGVRWFEVDRAETQRDKRSRLENLGIEARNIVFLSRDLRDEGLAAALVNSGYEPDASSLMLCEGVAVYLQQSEVQALFGELRSLATVGTRMALSLSVSGDSIRRRGLESAVAALGEPVLSAVTADKADELLAAARWRATEISDRSKLAGLVVAAPLWVPATSGRQPVTSGHIGTYLERVFHRQEAESVADHLSSTYDINVAGTRQLDVGVFRVDRSDGPPWIARIFPAARSVQAAQRDGELLGRLVAAGFPAERCAHPEPVSTLAGQAVLVTELAPGKAPSPNGKSYRLLGDLLGRLHSLPDSATITTHPGARGTTSSSKAAVPGRNLPQPFRWSRTRGPVSPRHSPVSMRRCATRWRAADDCHDLPCAVVHPDFVPANLVSSPGDVTVVDWAGAGWGPGCGRWGGSSGRPEPAARRARKPSSPAIGAMSTSRRRSWTGSPPRSGAGPSS